MPESPERSKKWKKRLIEALSEREKRILLSLIMLAVEIVFEFLNIISQSKKQNNKGMIILSSITLILIIIFGLLQVKELISTFIEVLS